MNRKYIWSVLVILLLLAGWLTYSRLFPSNNPTSPAVNTQKPLASPDKEQLFRLHIPKINLNTPVIEVGLNAQGDMDDPDSPKEVGWYKNGPRPGSTGSAVITGHFGWRGTEAAAFDNLHQLQPGDKVSIDDHGTSKTFMVRESQVYDPEAKAPEVFNRSDGTFLNLITCQGKWDEAKKSYSERLVVFTDLVS